MFDKKSDFSMNKREKNAIIYLSATGAVRLTRADFGDEEEFLKWKEWSDRDYQTDEQAGRGFYDNIIPLDEKLDMIGAVFSIEDKLFGQLEKAEHIRLCMAILEQVRSFLTAKQYRRLFMLRIDNMSIEAIAAREGVSHQSVSESISAAKNNIFVFLQKHPAEIPSFL